MSQAHFSAGDVTPFMDLLTSPAFLWSQTESDDETDHLWLQLCRVIFEGIPSEVVEWLGIADPPCRQPYADSLEFESQETAVNLLTVLRVGQKYWGVGVTAGTDWAEIGTWAGNLGPTLTIHLLRNLTHQIRERFPSLEADLFRHVCDQSSHRIKNWLASISPTQADVLAKYYGLLEQQRMTFAEIGLVRGVTRARVQQIESRALKRLGPAVKGELRAASRHRSRRDALDKAFRSLPIRPGKDVHHIDSLLNLADMDEAWWPCGISMLSGSTNRSTATTDRDFVREWLDQKPEVIWLETGAYFMKRPSESKSPYITAARKLLAIHETVPIRVVHEAVLDTWRSELWGNCLLSAEWLEAFYRSSSLEIEGDSLAKNELSVFPDELSGVEHQLLEALQGLGGVGSLDELRERIPDLRNHGSTLSQTLYNRTPIIQHIGPSIFGIRGAVHNAERIALLEDQALRDGHPWVNRGGWNQNEGRSLQYRIPARNFPQSRIRLPSEIVDALFDEDEHPGVLVWQTPDGVQHSVGVHIASGSTYLTGVRPIFVHMSASGGDAMNFSVLPSDIWAVNLVEQALPESIVINLGRGWTSVVL